MEFWDDGAGVRGDDQYRDCEHSSDTGIEYSLQRRAIPTCCPEIMANARNSSGVMQPKFLVRSGDGFLSSAKHHPAGETMIQLAMMSYDTPTPNSTAAEGQVTGTVDGVVYLIKGTVASNSNMTVTPMSWGQNVTPVPTSSLANTFTIPELGINIPGVGGRRC